MSTAFPLTDRDRIEVGKPLPFSIFSADGKLLLAAGRVVESERLREMLMIHGRFRGSMGLSDNDDSVIGGGSSRAKRDAREVAQEEKEAPPEPPPTPLERMRQGYDLNADRLTLSIARNETDKAHTVQLLGTYGPIVMVTAPVKPDGSLVPVQVGQAWLCRTFQIVSAMRFATVATKVVFDPFPHLCLKLQKAVEHRRVRDVPRVRVSLSGQLHGVEEMPCVVTDLSATGARVAIDYPLALECGSDVRLAVSVPMFGSKRDLSLAATIVKALGPLDTRYPEVSFYGIQFKAPTELDTLALHAFVNAELLFESNGFWHMLPAAARMSWIGAMDN